LRQQQVASPDRPTWALCLLLLGHQCSAVRKNARATDSGKKNEEKTLPLPIEI
jgi:hypothetical protein